MRTNGEIIQDLEKLAEKYHYDCYPDGTINEQDRANYIDHNKIDIPNSGNPIKSNLIKRVFKPRTVEVGKLLRLYIEKFIRESSGYYKVKIAESETMDIPTCPSFNTKYNPLELNKSIYPDTEDEYAEMLDTIGEWLQENAVEKQQRPKNKEIL
jgi:hypothetical protein